MGVAGAQGGGLHRNALVPFESGALRQARWRGQAGGRDHGVGFMDRAVGRGEAVAFAGFLQLLNLRAADKADRQVLPGFQQGRAHGLGWPAAQGLCGEIEQGDAVPAQGEVIGQFTAHQAGAHDHHILGRVAQGGAQPLVGRQVVDAPAQRGRQRRRQGGVGPVSQHELVVAQGAARGAQGAGGRIDANGVGLGEQANAQAPGRFGAGFLDEFAGVDLPRHGHRQQRLVVHIGLAGADQRDGQIGVVGAQGLCGLPAGAATAHDDHTRCVSRGGHDRGGVAGARLQLLQARSLVGFEIAFGHAAQRAGPVVGNVVKAGAGGETTVGVAGGFVVDVAAGVADELAVGRDGLDGRGHRALALGRLGGSGVHAGISSALSRAISLRRCLIAGVTMATNCASRTRRCTSECMR